MVKGGGTTGSQRSTDPQSSGLSEGVRAAISVFLFIHLFALLVCLAANLAPSLLEQRLLWVLRPYVQLLNFDLDGTRYFLTRASERDVDHRLEILAEGDERAVDASWQNIVRGVKGSERYHRYQRLADMMSFFQEDDEVTALLAASVVRSYRFQEETRVSRIRCRRHTLQSWERPVAADGALDDPDSPQYFSVLYYANVVTTPEGDIRLVKRAAAALEAPTSHDRRPAVGGASGSRKP